MAGLLDRISRVFGGGKDVLQPSPDRREQFEDHFAEQTELLQQVRRGAASVASSRKLLARQLVKVAAEMDSLTVSARRALQQGRDDLAREALLRRRQLAQQLAVLERDHDQLQLEEERLVITSTRLQAKLDAIRVRQDADSATYSAAEARARVGEALDQMRTDVGRADAAVQQAAARTRTSQASLAATEAILDLRHLASTADDLDLAAGVADELAAMKTELAAPGPVETGQGSYLQPGRGDAGGVQDAWGREADSRPDDQDAASSR